MRRIKDQSVAQAQNAIESFKTEAITEAIQIAEVEAIMPKAGYLIDTPGVSDNLKAGLEALGYSV